MTESGPKKTNLLSKLVLDSNPTCCDPSVCCPELEANCCGICTNFTRARTCCSYPIAAAHQVILTKKRPRLQKPK